MALKWSDAWVFAAAVYAAEGSRSPTLSALIAAADAINHAIPTIDELNGAYLRLTAAGLASREGNALIPTQKGVALYHSANPNRRPMLAEVNALEERLKEVIPGERTPSEPLSEAELDSAYRAYTRRA